MIVSLYINNYKCFFNTSLQTEQLRSVLLIGKNGVGKTGLMEVLGILQAIGRGEHRVERVATEENIPTWSNEKNFSFELEAKIGELQFRYKLHLDMPDRFSKFRIADELLEVNKTPIFNRTLSSVSLNGKAAFSIDWHYFALPLIFENDRNTPVIIFRNWLATMLLLSPNPRTMRDVTNGETDYLNADCDNFVDFLITQINRDYSRFQSVREQVCAVMHDFSALKTVSVGENAKRLDVAFNGLSKDIRFGQLSDGEKIFILQAVILTLAMHNSEVFVFWDEPDNYLAQGEIQAFVRQLRSSFAKQGQIIITSHNQQTALAFSRENTLMLSRLNHSTPTNIGKIPDDIDFLSAVEDSQ